jgi:hypothetical protein
VATLLTSSDIPTIEPPAIAAIPWTLAREPVDKAAKGEPHIEDVMYEQPGVDLAGVEMRVGRVV